MDFKDILEKDMKACGYREVVVLCVARISGFEKKQPVTYLLDAYGLSGWMRAARVLYSLLHEDGKEPKFMRLEICPIEYSEYLKRIKSLTQEKSGAYSHIRSLKPEHLKKKESA